MATGYLRPNAEASQGNWGPTPNYPPPYDLWSKVDKSESEGTPTEVEAFWASGSPLTSTTAEIDFEAYSASGLSEDISQLIVHAFIDTLGSSAAMRVATTIDLSNNEGELVLVNADADGQWYTTTYTPSGGNWSSTDIDGLTVSFIGSGSSGYQLGYVYSVYVELVEAAAAGGSNTLRRPVDNYIRNLITR